MPEELNIVMKESDILKKGDFIESFRKVIDVIVHIQKQQAEAINRLEETYRMIIEKLRNDHTISLGELKKQTNQLFVGERLGQMEKDTKDSFSKLQNSIDKKIKDAEMLSETLRSESSRAVSAAKAAESSGASSAARIAEAANSVRNIQTIRGIIIEELKKIRDELETVKRTRTRSMGRVKVPMIRAIDLSASVDGSATTFTLPLDTVRVLGVWGTQFPVTFRQDVDWTFAGNTLTLVVAQVGTPQSGQTLWALVETLFYA